MDLLRHLQYFVAIAEEGHFGHAARRLGMTQPPLSKGVQRLEADLGVRLLDRGPRGTTLTDAGAALLPHARRLFDAERGMRDTARTHATASSGVRLGVAPQLPAAMAATLAGACSSDGVNDSVMVHTTATVETIDAVTAGRLHAGVVVHPAVLGRLDGGDVVRFRTALLVPRRAAAVTGALPSRLRDVVSLPLAVPPRAHAPAAHDLLVDTLEAHGVTTGTATVEDERSALALVATGQACLVTADPHITAPGVVRLDVPGDLLPLRVRTVWDPHVSARAPSGIGQRLTAALVAAADELASPS